MIRPAPLEIGDKIAMVSPAGKIDPEVVHKAAALLREHGFLVELSAHALGQHYQYSGSDEERSADLQQALDDPAVKAIFFTRGGYGSLRTFMRLDWSRFLKHPKWMVGFSDITVFHSYLTCQGIASIHGVMSAFFFEEGRQSISFEQMLSMLKGEPYLLNLAPHPLNRSGKASGILTGGNLSLIYGVRGTTLDPDFRNKILFLEDILEFDYHIDRMMMNLRFGKVLEQLAGLVVGYFTDTKPSAVPFGMNAYETILDAVSGYDYPVIFGFPAGHEMPNHPLLMGAEAFMEVDAQGVRFGQPGDPF
ncbi:MAG: LD-carboxypeptidase [Marinilabiliales bacterium]|nr:LD-carboxypeptidase [Marinilabiliales bacterium]